MRSYEAVTIAREAGGVESLCCWYLMFFIFLPLCTPVLGGECYLHDGGGDGGTESIVGEEPKPALCLPPGAPPIYSASLATPFQHHGTSEVEHSPRTIGAGQ